jgi:hypothetical protein
MIHWETALHATCHTALVADVSGNRLYVRRSAPRSRRFSAFINGERVGGGYDSLQSAQTAVEKIAAERGISA